VKVAVALSLEDDDEIDIWSDACYTTSKHTEVMSIESSDYITSFSACRKVERPPDDPGITGCGILLQSVARRSNHRACARSRGRWRRATIEGSGHC
jgi:hypothetical protein